MNTKKTINTKDSLKWLYHVHGRKNWLIVLLTLLNSLLGASGVLFAALLRNVVDSAAGHDAYGFKIYAVLIVLLIIAELAVAALARLIKELTCSSFENSLKRRLADNLLHKDYASVNAIHSGEWLNRFTSDTAVIANGYVDILPGLAGMTVKLISALIMIIALDKWFAYILVPGGAAVILVTYAFRKILKSLHKNIQKKDGKLRIFLQERLNGLMMIKTFAAEDQTAKGLDVCLDEHRKARMKRNHFSNFCNIGFAGAMDAMYLVGVFYCGFGILNGTVTYGTLTAITQLIGQVQSPFANISAYLPQYYAVMASAERLMEIEEFEEDLKQPAISCADARKMYETDVTAIGLSHAYFKYFPAVDDTVSLNKENMPPAVEDLSVEIKKGEYVAFTGHSGCGKSTALKLLMCVYRLDSGERYIIDKNGDKKNLKPSMRRLFAYVPQGNQLVSGTIREAVTFAEPESADDDERIKSALRTACADEFVAELENGIDTVLGERGTGLSEGQTQRISIARAIFSGSPVLLLDESTSALDEKTEKQVLENLRALNDRTVIIVTHRPAALSICDRIVRF